MLWRNALRRIWELLIFRDHWQGEFCVAAFGGIGWALVCFLHHSHEHDTPYDLLERIMPESAVACWFGFFGVMQVLGLVLGQAVPRLIGATGLFISLLTTVMSLCITAPWTKSISVYFACVFIEACAMIFQTAILVRFGRHPQWIGKQ